MRRLAFLFVGASLILSVGAMPAMADNGPHVTTALSGVGTYTGSGTFTGVTTDRCAGCHRAHTAGGAYLLVTDEAQLCYTCHGTSGTGATTDVQDGVQWNNSTTSPTQPIRGTTILGALRAGGFDNAAIGTNKLFQTNFYDAGHGASSDKNQQVIPPLASAYTSTGYAASTATITWAPTTSEHSIDGSQQIAWGGGSGVAVTGQSTTTGTYVNLECSSCHNPHGNGNYRILRTLGPGGTELSTGGVTIPDSTVKQYVTTNYWLADDPQSATVKAAAGSSTSNVSSAFLANISSWCGTCHTRVFDSSGSWGVPNMIPNATPVTTPLSVTFTASSKVLTNASLGTAPWAVGTAVVLSGVVASPNPITGTPNTYVINVGLYTNRVYYVVSTTGGYGLASSATGSASTFIAAGSAKLYLASDTTEDPNFTFRHASDQGYLAAPTTTGLVASPTAGGATITQAQNISADGLRNLSAQRPNCVTCHVAHGTDASMAGDANSTFSGAVQFPDGSAGDSFLLRVDNRATCKMCHNV